MSGRTVQEAELEIALAETFGRAPAAWATQIVREAGEAPDSRRLLVEAGFCEQDAARGAALMESGRYAGLEDVATSLLADPVTRGRNSVASPERVAQVVARAAAGAGQGSSTSGGSRSLTEGGGGPVEEKVTLDRDAYDWLLARSDRLKELGS